MAYYSHCLSTQEDWKSGRIIMDAGWFQTKNFFTGEKGFYNIDKGFIPLAKFDLLSQEKQDEIKRDIKKLQGVK